MLRAAKAAHSLGDRPTATVYSIDRTLLLARVNADVGIGQALMAERTLEPGHGTHTAENRCERQRNEWKMKRV